MSARPRATERETRDALRGLGAEGTLSEDEVRKLLRSYPIRKLQRGRTHVAEAIKGALRRMERSGELTIQSPEVAMPRRLEWSRWGKGSEDRAKLVEERAGRWITLRARQGERVNVARVRGQFKKQHRHAGGDPERLTEAAKGHLMKEALRGGLSKDPEAGAMLNLFSGGQSADAPARRSGLTITHVDIKESYPVETGMEVHTSSGEPTDLREAPEGQMVQWVAAREQVAVNKIAIVAAALPCHTWSQLDATLRPSNTNFRTRSGRATGSSPGRGG
jgi:hypothetical protein